MKKTKHYSLILVLIISLYSSIGSLFAANPASSTDPAKETEAPVTFVTVYFHPGPRMIITWILLLLAVAVIIFIFQRIIKGKR